MKTLTSQAQAAKAIRSDLKTAFKGVKFAVNSSASSMSTTVSISWNNGPQQKDVLALVNQYRYEFVDGTPNNRSDIPQVRFIFAFRHVE